MERRLFLTKKSTFVAGFTIRVLMVFHTILPCFIFQDLSYCFIRLSGWGGGGSGDASAPRANNTIFSPENTQQGRRRLSSSRVSGEERPLT
uniref:Uncharacterized protein n=1 Tax=Nelumbo nucifera TaxID=4432 RepID=A0A823A5N3_NELNU|nr:TPA_asm: hypothetical protein HUJ06_019045 [Nelumbo nucifera]